MDFNIKNKGGNIVSLAREIGYIFQREVSNNKVSLIRPLSRGGYPRFHLYIESRDEALHLSLHLDQKRPVYKSATDHAGEYDGTLVESETERIKTNLA